MEVEDRNRRKKRPTKRIEELNHRIKGMVTKATKNIKFGYKRKLNEQIKRYR